VYVVAQVRISPVFMMAKYLPEFQDQLRLEGFPKFRKGIVQEIVIDPQKPRVESSERFEFLAGDETLGIIVAQDAITLHTTRYSVFEEFLERFLFTLRCVHSAVNIGIVERVGLRYVDLIRDSGRMKINDFIQSGLQGLNPSELRLAEFRRRSELIGRTSVGTLAVRFYEQLGRAFPSDLGEVGLSTHVSVAHPEKVGLLDLDHAVNQNFEFNVDGISELMWDLHDGLDITFRNAVTKDALSAWGAQNVD
jgi:uncharacterized protein (TIGR04255 family)